MAVQHGNVVYQHMPKTGGTFVSEYLIRFHGFSYIERPNIHRPIYPGNTGPIKWMTVRHPVDWWVSVYKHLSSVNQRYILDGLYQPKAIVMPFMAKDINVFFENIIKWLPDYWTKLVESYRPMECKYVVRTSEINEALMAMCPANKRSKRRLEMVNKFARSTPQKVDAVLRKEIERLNPIDWVPFTNIDDIEPLSAMA